MKRRKFMKGAGYLSLLAFLQACRLTDLIGNGESSNVITARTPTALPTFTPSPTLTPFTVPTDASPTATGTPTPESVEPSPSATTEPTTEAEPTATPTPTPTPYPPGPPSKLGLFLTKFEGQVLEMLETAQPALIKTLEYDANYVAGLKAAAPNSILIARMVLGDQNLDADPLALAQEYTEQLLPLATDTKRMDAIDAWEAYNEPVADTADKMKRLADFEAERVRIMAENGLRAVVGNFATGHPPLELWPDFKPALDAARQYNGFLGLHEYSAPVMQFMAGDNQPDGSPSAGDEGWLTLRYRKIYRQFLEPMGLGDLPLLITECGVDGLVQPRPGPPEARGWQEFIPTWIEDGYRDDPPGVYMDQLIWYDQNLQQDDYVKGAAIFTVGTNDSRWNSYNIVGEGSGRMFDLLTQYLEVHPPA